MDNKSNDAYEDLHKQSMDNDILKWTKEIDTIDLEMLSYRNLLSDHVKDDAAKNGQTSKTLLQGIANIQTANQMFKSTFEKYSNSLVGLAECDDLQCESYFLNEHAQLKESIEAHFLSYQKFKVALLSDLKSQS